MNPHDPMAHDRLPRDHNPHDEPRELPDALRWQLRGLRQEQTPAHDLWPGIAARLQAGPARASTPRPSHRRWAPVGLAASLLLALGVLGLWRDGAPQAPAAAQATLVQREAEGMTLQYRAALTELQAAPMPPAIEPAIAELDRSAELILAALSRDPDSRLLLEQLRRTYDQRLALAQRVVYS